MRSHLRPVHGACFAALILSIVGAPARAAAGPIPVSPGAAGYSSRVEGRCPTFSWVPVASASAHELEVFRLSGEGEPATVLERVIPGAASSWTPDLGSCFEPGGRYAWTVRAVPREKQTDTEAAWSGPHLFEISELPSAAEVEEALAVLGRYRNAQSDVPSEAPASSSTGAPARPPRALTSPTVGPGPAPRATPTLGSSPSLTVDGNIDLGATSNVFKSGKPFLWSDTISSNTAVGEYALNQATTGSGNTAMGASALQNTDEGSKNSAFGVGALTGNTTGTKNSAFGFWALFENVSGSRNVAIGQEALHYNTTGESNLAAGYRASFANETGYKNVALGDLALRNGTTANRNTAVGTGALQNLGTGSFNIGIGIEAGIEVLGGNDNIFIDNRGVSGDNGTIRIGNSVQVRTFLAGVRGTPTGVNDAIAVLVDSAGQLGTASSSRRYKEDVHDMESVSERLFALRPVTFRYKQEFRDGEKPLQFGLIAEEVAEVFPELVVYDGAGRPETVKYRLLSTLLLNELQKQHAALGELDGLRARLAALEAELAEVRAAPGL